MTTIRVVITVRQYAVPAGGLMVVVGPVWRVMLGTSHGLILLQVPALTSELLKLVWWWKRSESKLSQATAQTPDFVMSVELCPWFLAFIDKTHIGLYWNSTTWEKSSHARHQEGSMQIIIKTLVLFHSFTVVHIITGQPRLKLYQLSNWFPVRKINYEMRYSVQCIHVYARSKELPLRNEEILTFQWLIQRK